MKLFLPRKINSGDSEMTTRPGSRLVDGVEEFGKAIYPEIFK